jgi:hypothetical protein
LYLNTHQKFRAVSDGSVLSTGEASYGWILSTHRGERVAEGMGPARGRIVHSYRAEACGILLFLRFLIRISNFTQMHDQWQGVLATDSQSVLDTLFGRNSEQTNNKTSAQLERDQVELDPLCPEWDVLIEIQAALRELPRVQLQYVAGHQDKKEAYNTLSLLEHLNVDADRIAVEYHELHHPHMPYVLLSPNTRAYLLFQDGTVTSKYDDSISLQATTPPLKSYLARKYTWNESAVDRINWIAHGQALKRNKHRRSHMVKFAHDILPTTSMRNKYDEGNRKCPLCSDPNEHCDHILCCKHQTRETWRRTYLREISTYCQHANTCPQILQLLITVFGQWFNGDNSPQILLRQYPPELHHLIRSQQIIGWRHLFQGHFANAWEEAQKRYHERIFPNQQYTQAKWQVGLITKIWDQWYLLWTQRNNDVYGKDERIAIKRPQRTFAGNCTDDGTTSATVIAGVTGITSQIVRPSLVTSARAQG